MPQFRVQVCQFPGGNSTHPAASDYLAGLYPKLIGDPRIGPNNVIAWRRSDTPITMTRNQALISAEQNRADYVVMIDSDMHPDIVSANDGGKPFWDTSWQFMLDNPNAGMIAAPYCGPEPDACVYVFRWQTMQHQMPNPNTRIEMYDRHTASFLTGIQQAAALPTGLCIINMKPVYTGELKKPWFDYEWKDRHGTGETKCQTCGHPIPGERADKASTEDVFFSRNMQSIGGPDNKAKYPIYCNWDSWAGHYKLKCIGPPQRLPMDFFPAQARRWADAAPTLPMADPYPKTPDLEVTMTASDTNPRHFLNAGISDPSDDFREGDTPAPRFTFPLQTSGK